MNPVPAAGRYLLVAGIVLYALLSLWSLPWFPFVHSDEAWLASLTRSMIEERSIAATEDFFVLTPRHPHAIKVIYHLLQMAFVGASFGAVSVRLLSWAAGVGSLVLIYLTARRVFGLGARGAAPGLPAGATVTRSGAIVPVLAAVGLFAGDLQLLTAFHTARQEALLLLVFVFALLLHFRRADSWRARGTVVLGVVLGGSFGIHPNSFIIAAPFVPLMLMTRLADQSAAEGRRRPGGNSRLVQAGLLIVILAGFAALFVGLSLLMDPEFFTHYAAFGRSVGVGDSLLQRWFRLQRFVGKLYHQTAGTYYLPPIRLQLLLAAGAVGGGILVVAWSLVRRGRRLLGAKPPGSLPNELVVRALPRLLICIVVVALAIFAVGKYSPPSVVFILPPLFLLVGSLVAWTMDRFRPWRLAGAAARAACVAASFGVAALLVGSGVTTVRELAAWHPISYTTYQQSILYHGEQDEIVLGNLNSAFAFEYDRLRTWRDLDRLNEAGLSVQQFVEREGISVILYPDELDLIYRERPVWNDVYGNLYPYYDDLQKFLAEQCELVGTYSEPVYAMRLVSRMSDADARLRVYRVLAADGDSDSRQ